MKSFIVAVAGLSVAFVSGVAVGQDTAKGSAPAPAETKDLKAKASYGIGLDIGRRLKAASADVDPDMITRGLKDALLGTKPMLTDEQLQVVMKEYQQILMAKQQEVMAKRKVEALGATDKNKKEGDAFLAANKAKPGIVTLPSGLQYKVIKGGDRPDPQGDRHRDHELPRHAS